jgi:hypothetical protein
LVFSFYAGERLISVAVSARVSFCPDNLFVLAAKQIAPNAIKTAVVIAYDIGASAMHYIPKTGQINFVESAKNDSLLY